ncbi:hypothetical protein Salat_1459700 [Sesamum alatum]|uniref:Uncharacterized protein n=1 Tax=Sesamum alatum TaxID=300844 RepID=A0AAE1YAX2_9LAMI|nr:hypothetical protein Salat_1459700 [Sesamum alatum]
MNLVSPCTSATEWGDSIDMDMDETGALGCHAPYEDDRPDGVGGVASKGSTKAGCRWRFSIGLKEATGVLDLECAWSRFLSSWALGVYAPSAQGSRGRRGGAHMELVAGASRHGGSLRSPHNLVIRSSRQKYFPHSSFLRPTFERSVAPQKFVDVTGQPSLTCDPTWRLRDRTTGARWRIGSGQLVEIGAFPLDPQTISVRLVCVPRPLPRQPKWLKLMVRVYDGTRTYCSRSFAGINVEAFLQTPIDGD